MDASNIEHLDLRTTAEVLGVHYQTAYRWVRSGRLPAHLVNGHYLVATRDLARADARRQRPSPRTLPSQKRLDHQADRMREALLSGDEATARRLAQRLVTEGASIVSVIQTLLVPVLRDIGQAWKDGELPVSIEHRASGICERLLGDLAPNPRGRRRGNAVVAAIAGDRHALPTTMATIGLRDANWNVHHLGADTPPEELQRFCADHDVDVVVLTVTNPDAAALAHRTAAELRSTGVATVVGAPGRTLGDLLDEMPTTLPSTRRMKS
ncbi:MAG: B12-binding domain-containing protein [Ilumatobacteraceae bacterium]